MLWSLYNVIFSVTLWLNTDSVIYGRGVISTHEPAVRLLIKLGPALLLCHHADTNNVKQRGKVGESVRIFDSTLY